MQIKLGIIREGKVPPDKRVPLSPKQCVHVMNEYPNIEIVVQKSPIRAFKDEEYSELGIKMVDDLYDCDIIFGVKEVNIEDLIPNKHFFFFSHTIKKQPYNRKLLQAILSKKILLTDYEVLKDKNGKRIIGFGRYAGIVGCYNALLTYGLKHSLYQLKPAHQCYDRREMEAELSKIQLPNITKIAVTGNGRAAHGVLEILEKLSIKKVSSEDFLNKEFDYPTFAQLSVQDYIAREDGMPFNKAKFYENSENHFSTFHQYLEKANLYVAAHFWKTGSPNFYTHEDLKTKDIQTSVVADISCDIDGPIASTIRASTVADPVYGYDINTGKEVHFMEENAIAVMAVDNLPCELPKDASIDFGNELIGNVFPVLFGDDPDKIIERASETTRDGTLSPYFKYLEDYSSENEKKLSSFEKS